MRIYERFNSVKILYYCKLEGKLVEWNIGFVFGFLASWAPRNRNLTERKRNTEEREKRKRKRGKGRGRREEDEMKTKETGIPRIPSRPI